MKLFILKILLLLGIISPAQVNLGGFMPISVPAGGTGFSSTTANSIIVSGPTATSSLRASSTLWVVGINATSTTASSTFKGLEATTLGVTGTSTLSGLSAGFGTFSSNLVSAGILSIQGTGTSTFSGGVLFNTSGGSVGISSSTPTSPLSLGSFGVGVMRIATTTIGIGNQGTILSQSGTTTVNGTKTFDWVNEAGLKAFANPPVAVISVVFDSNATTILVCTNHTITTTSMVIECQTIADGVTAVVNADATDRTIHFNLTGKPLNP